MTVGLLFFNQGFYIYIYIYIYIYYSLSDIAVSWNIYSTFCFVLGCPDRSEWCNDGGRNNGTIALILKHLKYPINYYATVQRVLKNILAAWDEGEDYDPKRKAGTGGKNVMIDRKGEEAQIAVDLYEFNTLSVVDVADNLNIERKLSGLPEVGVSSVYNFFKALTTKRTAIGKTKQGAESSKAWAEARVAITAQWLVRGGEYSDNDKYQKLLDDHFQGVCPTWLDRDVLRRDYAIDLKKGICYFDEKHIKQQVGGFGLRTFRFRFKRNKETGALDEENGTFLDVGRDDKVLQMKYSNEFRAGFGTAIRLNPVTDVREGIVLPIFDYTSKLLDYVGKFEEAKEKERKKVLLFVILFLGTSV